jgi:glycosyltransferase involved in cell wall biosynthesis
VTAIEKGPDAFFRDTVNGASKQAAEGRNLLLVAYFYPPSRDTGAQRPASMARHLRSLGHRVTVLTTRAYGSGSEDEPEIVRTADLQLLRARLRGKDRVDALYDADTYAGRPHPLSRVLVPEPLVVAWAPFARRAAVRLHRERRFDCVITSSPPESAHLVGRALRRRGVPWVADVRDAWTFEALRPRFPTAAQRRFDERLERRWLGEADAVVCVSPPVAEDFRARGIATPVVVPNGWDPISVPGGGPAAETGLDPGRVSLVYTGRFGSYGRDPGALVEALRALAAEEPESAARLELVIAGPLTTDEARLLEADVSPARIVAAGSLPRERALALQREADALLLLASPTRTQLANYKLFEYLAAGRPILALAAGTEAGRIVEEAGGRAVRADDPEAIAGELRRLAAGELSALDPEAARAYSYPALAERMAAVVEGAIARANPGL